MGTVPAVYVSVCLGKAALQVGSWAFGKSPYVSVCPPGSFIPPGHFSHEPLEVLALQRKPALILRNQKSENRNDSLCLGGEEGFL